MSSSDTTSGVTALRAASKALDAGLHPLGNAWATWRGASQTAHLAAAFICTKAKELAFCDQALDEIAESIFCYWASIRIAFKSSTLWLLSSGSSVSSIIPCATVLGSSMWLLV